MADGTTLNSQAGGDKIDTEDIGTRGKLQRMKIVTGALDTDGGDVTTANPFWIALASLIAGENLTDNVLGVTRKPIATATYNPLVDSSFGTKNANTSKASQGNILSFDVTNVNAALRFFQLFNKATTPVNTDVPIFSFPVPAGTATVPVRLTL